MDSSQVSPSDPLARAPFITFWETTRACDLACRHCRASAMPARDPRELATESARSLLRDIRATGCPLVVLTGGDPGKREDLVELVAYGHSLGLRMALTPSATPLLTTTLLERLRAAGLARLAMSLDGLREAHDTFRGAPGSFERTMRTLEQARALGLTIQVNTTVGRHNLGQLPALADEIATLGLELWSVFFVVPTGRASRELMLDAAETEAVLEWLAQRISTVSHDIKTTALPHFRRVLLTAKTQRERVRGVVAHDGIGRMPRGINDGQGVLFVSHVGDIYPSGFLPLRCGNVRTDSLAEVYRSHPLFLSLRDPEALQGKCGACEFRRVCGGSRARAYAIHGNALAEEPSCAYVPKGYRQRKLPIAETA